MDKVRYILILFILIFGFQVFGQSYKLIIDAGHGGRDPGNIASSSKMANEKHLNLDIALLLGKYIERNMKNISVIYTRTSDKSVSLEDRVFIANNKKADFFISIHANSNNLSNIKGCRVHIHNSNFGNSKKLAQKIVRQMNTTAGRKNLGIQDSRQRGYSYFVLENTSMPAVLIECGFMSNQQEEKFLNSEKGKKLIALAIYKGFDDFLKNKADKPTAEKEKNQNGKNKQLYKVQIRASTKVIPQHKFKKLGMSVEEVVYNEGIFKYKYFVGGNMSFENAKKIRKKVIEKGFKDAFIVKM